MKVPKARKLPSGSWFIQLRIGGESVPVTESSEAKCTAKAMAIKSGLLQASKVKALPTLGQSIDSYIANRENVLSPSTIRGYDTIRQRRFQAYMNENLSKFSDEYCQSIIDAEAPTCSPKTLKNSWLLISSSIFKATGERKAVTLPQEIKHEHKFLDYKQIEVFVKAIKGRPVEVPALLALSSLRRSEIFGLQWDNIDLKKGIIAVSGSAVFDKNQKFIRKKTNKNQSSARTIPILMPQLSAALKLVKNKTGPVVREHPNTLLEQINAVCRGNGLPEVGVHGLRHSFASLAYHLDIPEKIAMDIGGWKDNEVMHKIYTHVAKSDMTYYKNKMMAYYKKIANEDANKKIPS